MQCADCGKDAEIHEFTGGVETWLCRACGEERQIARIAAKQQVEAPQMAAAVAPDADASARASYEAWRDREPLTTKPEPVATEAEA